MQMLQYDSAVETSVTTMLLRPEEIQTSAERYHLTGSPDAPIIAVSRRRRSRPQSTGRYQLATELSATQAALPRPMRRYLFGVVGDLAVAEEVAVRRITDDQAKDELLQLVREQPGIGEWDMAEELHLPVMRVCDLVRELEQEGTVRRGDDTGHDR